MKVDDWFMKVQALLECEDLDAYTEPGFVLPEITEASYGRTTDRP